MSRQVIQIQLEAPRKPAEGEPCNGCGVCCLAEPCPVGVLVSRRTTGECAALVWSDDRHYRCGLIARPAHYLPASLGSLSPLVARMAHRFVSTGSGCDCSLSVEGG